MRASFSTDLAGSWLTTLEARSKMAVCIVAAIATVALSNPYAQIALFAGSFAYLIGIRRPMVILVAYVFMAVMMGISVACTMGLAHYFPIFGRGMDLKNLAVPFLRGLTMLNVVLPLAFTTRVQNILQSLQSLRLPFCIYLPAAVMIRFIPTFANDVKQVWESLKIRGWHLNPLTCTIHPVMTTRLLFAPMLFRSLKTSDELGIAAELKGLGSGRVMQQYREVKWGRNDWVLVAGAILVAALAAYLEWRFPVNLKGAMK